ncbi:DMT family transporter [Neotamlana laminarinivorans]|uniref:DMT family transporter n=1 Tax=Neotamlana laminarinivorans TaxID=2883124 RepID=A0A9X1HZI2_9FLAO|nr:DMT family transporter [Tamlana laminarinivorans]MCB4799024.1 DMT family transporter [Tamlana laminarinivorans]
MPNANLKSHLHLHVLVFIAGFTAILGELISISAVPLVWFRMVFASIFMFIYIKVAKINLKVSPKSIFKLAIAGIIIALHWITFFGAIEVANISIALAMFSTGAFFASFIEPVIYKRKIVWYEILFGVIVVLGVFIITQGEIKYLSGIILGIVSAFLSSLFAVLNGSFLKKHSATTISFYEFISGIIFISIYIFIFKGGFSLNFFQISSSDLIYLLILASVCTTYAFIASIYVMKDISPYTVVLTYNLEPVYGIILAVILFPEKEKMTINFYIGAAVILTVVLLNASLKYRRKLKRKYT